MVRGTVSACKRGQMIVLHVDDKVNVKKRTSPLGRAREYFLGGLPELARAGVRGCTRDVYVDGCYLSQSCISTFRIFQNQTSDIVIGAFQLIYRYKQTSASTMLFANKINTKSAPFARNRATWA